MGECEPLVTLGVLEMFVTAELVEESGAIGLELKDGENREDGSEAILDGGLRNGNMGEVEITLEVGVKE